jgi:hypothetical protein
VSVAISTAAPAALVEPRLALAASNAQLLRFVAEFVGWYSFFSEF